MTTEPHLENIPQKKSKDTKLPQKLVSTQSLKIQFNPVILLSNMVYIRSSPDSGVGSSRIFLVNRQSRGKKLGEINLFFLVSGSRIKNTRGSRGTYSSSSTSSPPTKRKHGGGDTFQANRSIEFTMSPPLSAVFLRSNGSRTLQ